MKPEDIKKTLQSGGKVFGTMINFVEGSRWATAFSSKALDYVIIDAEHGSYSRGEVARMVAIGQSVGLSVIVRVADPDPTLVAIALDSRADGVLVPYCEDAEMIQRCAWKVQLHPLKGKAFEDVLTNSFEVVNGLIKPRLSRENHMKILYEIWNENISLSLESINSPVLILPVSSDNSESVSPNMHGVSKKDAVNMAMSKLSKSEVIWLKNSIHDVPIQNPKLIVDAILQSKDTLFT